MLVFFFFQAEDGIRDKLVTGVQTCALPISPALKARPRKRAAPRSGAEKSEKLWGGRFTTGADPAAERFTGSIAFDRRLWPHDIAGSVAWAKALARAGLLSAAERDAIVRGLAAVRDELAAGTFPYRAELEDIHTHVQRRLQEMIGRARGQLHTRRPRHDPIPGG